MTFIDLMFLFNEIEKEGKKVTDIYFSPKDFSALRTNERFKYITFKETSNIRGAKVKLSSNKSYLFCSSLDGTDTGKRIYDFELDPEVIEIEAKVIIKNKMNFIVNLN